jgi:DNA-binding CsgD family transcriptional regulator
MTTPIASHDLSNLILRIYEGARSLDLWPDILQDIATAFGDYGANLYWTTPESGARLIVSPTLAEGLIEYSEKWLNRDTRAKILIDNMNLTSSRSMCVSQYMTDEEMDADPHFVEFLYKWNLKDGAVTFLMPERNVLMWLVIQRQRDRPNFRPEELDLLTDLGRHVENALYLAMELTEARLKVEGLGQGFDMIDIAVFGVNRQNQIGYTNRLARRLLEQLGEAGIERLFEQVPAAQRDASRLLAIEDRSGSDIEATRSLPGGAHIYVDNRSGLRLLVRVIPLSSGFEGELFGLSELLMMVAPMTGDRQVDHSVVRDALDLTAAEARLAAIIATGISLDDAAEKIGVTRETARTMLKRVFQKTNTSRQHELTALILNLRG